MCFPDKTFVTARERIDRLVADVAAGRARRPTMFMHNDLDGAGCAVMFKARFGKNADAVSCHANSVDRQIAEYLDAHPDRTKQRFLVLADISPSEELAERLDGYATDGPGVLLLDHHASEMWLNRFDWAFVDPAGCGALHCYDVLTPGERYGDLARVIDDYDRWLRQDARADVLNQLCTIYGQRRFIARFLADPSLDLSETERLLVELENEERARELTRVRRTLDVRTLADGVRLGVGYGDHYVSHIAHELLEEIGLDAIALVSVTTGKVSLRSRPGIDVGTLGLVLGGGGHPEAAAFPSDVVRAGAAELRTAVAAEVARGRVLAEAVAERRSSAMSTDPEGCAVCGVLRPQHAEEERPLLRGALAHAFVRLT